MKQPFSDKLGTCSREIVAAGYQTLSGEA